MRINEYNSLEEFTSQYVGEWGPSDGHWLGLDFMYNNRIYRFSTGSMYGPVILSSGEEALFYVYQSPVEGKHEYPTIGEDYILIGAYSCMNDVLENCIICEKKFKEVIMADETELLGQD